MNSFYKYSLEAFLVVIIRAIKVVSDEYEELALEEQKQEEANKGSQDIKESGEQNGDEEVKEEEGEEGKKEDKEENAIENKMTDS